MKGKNYQNEWSDYFLALLNVFNIPRRVKFSVL